MPLSKVNKRQYMRDLRQSRRGVGEVVGYHVIPKSEKIPLYNPATHKPGDKVKMITGEVYIIPELDADGNQIWE